MYILKFLTFFNNFLFLEFHKIFIDLLGLSVLESLISILLQKFNLFSVWIYWASL